MGVQVLVLLLKLIQIWHRLDFVKIKNLRFKISKYIDVSLKIARVLDDTSVNITDEKKGEETYLFSRKL